MASPPSPVRFSAVRIAFGVLCVTLCLPATGRAETVKEREAFFQGQVLPLLESRCFECHSHAAGKAKGGFVLDSRSGWEKGGDSGPAILPGQAGKSLLIQAVRYQTPKMEMPPKARLSREEIAVLEKWVASGAHDSRVMEGVKSQTALNIEAGRRHWAFQPVKSPTPPGVMDAAWPEGSVDRFILAGLEKSGLRPAPDTDRHTWLRRVSLDLTGLPPTLPEIESFLGDTSPEAHARVVDRLLDSPAFGERWARHWLDLTGYADQVGTSNEVFAEHAWRYRDYLIDSFNTDKPFDRFIREQIAGDLLPYANAEQRATQLIATGFLLLGDIEIVQVDKLKMELDVVDQQVSKVGTAFLGMTLGCVRCHDHKFDPIGLEDYYGMAGIFRATDSTHKTERGIWSMPNERDLPETPEQQASRAALARQHAERVRDLRHRKTETEREKAALEPKVAELKDQPEARAPLEKQREDLNQRVRALSGEIDQAMFFTPGVPRAFAVNDTARPEDMRRTIRGNPHALGETIPRGSLRVASWEEPFPIPARESGRHQLADWIADARNPLTARVTVNRLWQKLFGEGLVRSVDYFGTRGEAPSHPELLDHLATRFTQNGWSQKRLLRELALSRAYRMGSAHDSVAESRDPENRLLWRMNRQRLDAEVIRDAMLAASGTMATAPRGPSLPLELPGNVGNLPRKSVNPPSFAFRKFRPEQEGQRTLYLPVVRTGAQPGAARLRDVFDFTSPAQMSGQRPETAVPTQALFLINGDTLRQRAAALANDLCLTVPEPASRVETLWRRVLSRPPTSEERTEAEALLRDLSSHLKEDRERWAELAHALFASNEFLIKL